MGVLNIATLSNCTLTSQSLHNATLTNCTLRNVELHSSTITGSTFHNCRLYDCTIHTSTFHKSSIFYAKHMLKCQFNDTDIRAAPPELKKLPVEVREMIFKEAYARLNEQGARYSMENKYYRSRTDTRSCEKSPPETSTHINVWNYF
jgi:uncharacterized protein YjbI with pentapeptide repeats